MSLLKAAQEGSISKCRQLLEAGSDVGERSLELVRREEAEVGAQLRCARANLDSAQEIVTTQTTLINRLEASQNSLTNKKLEIEGQQQKQAATEAKKEELVTAVNVEDRGRNTM